MEIEIVNNEINSHEIICSDGAEVIKLSYQTINSTAFAKGCIEMIPELQKKSTGFDSDIKIKTNMLDYSIYSANGNIITILEDFEGSKKKLFLI